MKQSILFLTTVLAEPEKVAEFIVQYRPDETEEIMAPVITAVPEILAAPVIKEVITQAEEVKPDEITAEQIF